MCKIYRKKGMNPDGRRVRMNGNSFHWEISWIYQGQNNSSSTLGEQILSSPQKYFKETLPGRLERNHLSPVSPPSGPTTKEDALSTQSQALYLALF